MWHPLVTANATQITPQNQRFDLRSEYPLCGLASNHFSKDNFYFILFHRIGSDLFRVGTPHPQSSERSYAKRVVPNADHEYGDIIPIFGTGS